MIPALLLWVALGQQPDASKFPHPLIGQVPAESMPVKPLKCGKFEHLESKRDCHEDPQHAFGLYGTCTTYPPRCVPTLHTVTEKEWQELNEKLRLVDLALRETICSNFNWKESISINGKTTPCATLKPNKKTGYVLPWEPAPQSRTETR